MNQTTLPVFGTCPKAIKMASLVKTLQGHSTLKVKVCVTARHSACRTGHFAAGA